MTAIFRQRFQRTQRQTASNPPTRKPSALDITEILEIVFSFLDDLAIRRSVVFVCRRWYHTCRKSSLAREVSWISQWSSWEWSKQDTINSRLVGASRFDCFISNKALWSTLLPLQGLLRDLPGLYQKRKDEMDRSKLKNRKKGTTVAISTLYAFNPLRELNLFLEGQHLASLDSFPFPPSLTTLRIETVHQLDGQVSLSRILRVCPLLEEFWIECIEYPNLGLTWESLGQTTQQPLLLRSFVLRNVWIQENDLVNLLSFTPRLSELKLMGCRGAFRGLNWIRLLRHLETLSLPLDSAHFSVYGKTMKDTEMQMLNRVCSRQSHWSLWILDITPLRLQEQEAQFGRITTLDLYWRPTLSAYMHPCSSRGLEVAPRQLFEHLCTSTRLVHLKTVKTTIMLENMDIHHRGGYVDLDTNGSVFSLRDYQPPRPQIWTCRGLQVLHLQVHGHGSSQFVSPTHARILFGYISRVFPHLEELQIEMPYCCVTSRSLQNYTPLLSMRLEGGLCLLSRLKRLSRLVIRSPLNAEIGVCEEHDLNWLVPSGRNAKYASRRQGQVASWRAWRQEEDRIEAARRQKQQQHQQGRVGQSTKAETISPSDPTILEQLENLGLLLDVELMVKELDSLDFQPMWSLERLALGCRVAEHPESVLRRLFPKKRSLFALFAK